MKLYYKNKLINIRYKGKKILVKYKISDKTPVVLNINKFDVKVGDEFVLVDTKNALQRGLKWETSDPNIATVDNGIVTMLNEGEVTITCTNSVGNHDTCVLNVYNKEYSKSIDYYSENEELECCKYSIFAEDYDETNSTWKARKYETYTATDGTVTGSEDVATTGNIVKENGAIVFDGTQSIDMSSLKSLYGSSSVMDKYSPTYTYCAELEFSEFTDLVIHLDIKLNSSGQIFTGWPAVILYGPLELNKKYKLIIMRRQTYYATHTGYATRVILSYNNNIEYDSGWDTISTGGNWVEGLRMLQNTGFKGKLYNLKLLVYEYDAVKKNMNLTGDEGDAFDIEVLDNPIIKNYLINNSYKSTAPYLEYTNRYIVCDLATGEKPKIMVRLLSDEVIPCDNKSKTSYDILLIHPDGSIRKVYKNAISITNGRWFEFDVDTKIPYRDYLFFGLYDDNTKTIQKSKMFSIRFTDSRIESTSYTAKGNDVIAKQMYISPANLVGRPGDKKLLRHTFVPEQVANIKVKYISSDPSIATVGETDGIVEFISSGRCEITAISQSDIRIIAKSMVIVQNPIKDTEKATIDNSKYGITMGDGTESNSCSIAWANILGINNALQDLKSKGYKYIKLPEGHYYVACENMDNKSDQTQTIVIPTEVEFDITGCTIEQVMSENPDTRIIMLDDCDRSKLIGGTVIGDLFIHNYGLRINENGNMLEKGSYYSTDGTALNPNIDNGETYHDLDSALHDTESYYRTKDFITQYEDYETSAPEPLPSSFNITPLWKTTMNTVDGGQYYCFFYDNDNNYLGYTKGGFGTTVNMVDGATKIKLSFRSETWDKGIYCITKRNSSSHATFEFGSGVGFRNAFDCEINGTTIMNCQGDVSMTTDGGDRYFKDENNNYRGYDSLVNDARWINCTMKEARRQGISFVATGENYLILDSSIGNINGVDPQCGTDMEAYGRNEKYLFKNVTFHDNRKWDMVDCFSGDVEIDGCTFNGAIGLGQESYNWYVHDSNFIYDNKYNRNNETSDEWMRRYKMHNTTGAMLPIYRDDIFCYNICENCYFDGGSDHLTKGNEIKGASVGINKNNEMVNGGACNIYVDSEYLNYETDIIYLNRACKITNSLLKSNPNGSLEISLQHGLASIESDDKNLYEISSDDKVIAKSSTKVVAHIRNYKFRNLVLMGKGSGCIVYEDCDIILDDDCIFEQGTYGGDYLFKNCNISIPRLSWGYPNGYNTQLSYNYYNFTGIRFIGCNIEIRDVEATNNSSTINLISTHWEGNSTTSFKDCNITCGKTVNLKTTFVDNCTLGDNIVVDTHTPVTSISLPDSITVNVNNETTVNVTTNTSRHIFWELPVDGDMKLSYNNGVNTLICKKAGTYIVKAYSIDDSTVSDSMIVYVKDPSITEIPCTALSLNTNELTFISNESQSLLAVALPSTTTDTITYSAEPAGIVFMDNGAISPLKNGNCVITVRCGEQTATCDVSVNIDSNGENPQPIVIPVESISIESNKTIKIGESFALNAVFTPSNATNKNITWSTNNSNCTVIYNGISCSVTGKTSGTTIITATTEDGNHTATCIVTIEAPTDHIESLSLAKSSVTISEKTSTTISAIISPVSVVNDNVIWEVDDPTVIELTTNGLIATIKGLKTGNAVLTCTAEDTTNGTLTASCNITVDARSTVYSFATDFEVPSATNVYEIPLSTYSISNNNTNGTATTKGINDAIRYAKNNGYDGVKLPSGTYAIDTQYVADTIQLGGYDRDRRGIVPLSDMELILEGCVLKQIGGIEDPKTVMITIKGVDNVKVTGGTLIGDRDTHDYGVRINESGNEFERGTIDNSGNLVANNDCVRSKDYITNFPSDSFKITPLWNTLRNTVDAWDNNVCVHFYNNSGTHLGMAKTTFAGNAVTPVAGTTKIKIVLLEENNTDAVISLNTRGIWASYEFGTGIVIGGGSNIEINSVTIKDQTGDCIATEAMDNPLTTNVRIIDCDLSNARRQGISYCAVGSNFHVINCDIHHINGVDPQCGIDFEVGADTDAQRPKNIIVEGCNFYANKKWDIVNYDGMNVEIRNCTFDATVGTTYGYNMDIHDNTFTFNDHYPHPKHSYPEFIWLYMWDSVATDTYNPNNAFFKVYNNTFDGYNAGFMNTISLNNAENSMTNNVFRNCNNLRIQTNEPNTFENCVIDYILDNGTNISGSILTDCTIYTDNSHSVTFNGSTLTNCNSIVETSTSSTVASISMPSTMSIQQGESKLLKPMILPTTAHMEGEPLTHQFKFESSDYSKVFVSEAGYVTAIGDPEGVVITCSHRDLPDGTKVNVSATCTLTTN